MSDLPTLYRREWITYLCCMPHSSIKLIECPRDAMQGWPRMIPTQEKVDYLNQLLQVGFHTLDFGSFVSPKAIPQMADTAKVIPQLNLQESKTKLLAIIANERGAQDAVAFDEVTYLGFPFSVSETFQQRNTGSGILESLKRVEAIQLLCQKHQKKMVVYLSMGFGNPYGDPYSPEIVFEWVEKLMALEIDIFSLADTVGLATPEQVGEMTAHLVKQLPDKEVGVHLHSTAENWQAKLEAALQAGCLRFDGALKGIGGCPMSGNSLVGNMDTDAMINYLSEKEMQPALNIDALEKARKMADQIFV